MDFKHHYTSDYSFDTIEKYEKYNQMYKPQGLPLIPQQAAGNLPGVIKI